MKTIRLPVSLFALAAVTVQAMAEVVPFPRQKPSRSETMSVTAVPIPRLNPRRSMPEPGNSAKNSRKPEQQAQSSASSSASCQQDLKGLDITYETLKPIGDDGGCGAAAPIEVSRIAGVALMPPAVINCTMARELHGWVKGSLQPAAQRRLKTEVTTIHVAASYVCRRRNNSIGGKLSEHAKANALDMSGFSFAKSDAVSVGGSGSWGDGILKSIGLSKGGSFLDDIREGACTHFTTVLGPGSDPYHGDHFHIDAIARKGGYRICK